MNTQHDFCPGCGAQVYPEEARCPFCGRALHRRLLVPVAVGLGGAAVAMICGALVWWALSSPPPPSAEGPAQQASTPAAPEPPPAVSTTLPSSAPPSVAPEPQVPVVPAAPARASIEEQKAPVNNQPLGAAPAADTGVKDQAAFAPATLPRGALGAGSPALPVAASPAPVPSVAPPVTTLPAEAPPNPAEGANVTPDERRAFAKSKQDSFAQNGLDLQVTTSGPDDTTLIIKFNFAARTAAELIIAGPFPRQCAQRGFKEILFNDPSGATWAYNIATQQMTER